MSENNTPVFAEAVRLLRSGMSQRAVSRELGVPRSTLQRWLHKEPVEGYAPKLAGSIKMASGSAIHWAQPIQSHEIPKVNRYILTFAQNNCKVHNQFMGNLMAYAKYMNAQIIVGTGRRLKSHDQVSDLVRQFTIKSHVENYEEMQPIYLNGKSVLWMSGVRCGYGTINPVSDIGNGQGKWGEARVMIMPHPTPALTMVHGIAPNEVRQVYSTGSVTEPDVGAGKAGFRAASHWFPSALIVEIEGDNFWVRQLEGRSDGVFSDLDHYVSNSRVQPAGKPNVIVSPDCHFSRSRKEMIESLYGDYGLLATFRPKHHIMHDVFDGYSVNRHERMNKYRNFRTYVERTSGMFPSYLTTVSDELGVTARWINWLCEKAKETQHHIVVSNHDEWVRDWACNHDCSRDPQNLEEWHRVNLDILNTERWSVEQSNWDAKIRHWLHEILHRHGLGVENVDFIRNGQGLEIGGVEYSCHGDKGLSGAVGSIGAFSKSTGKITIAHSHSPAILWDAHRVGMGAMLNQGYNVGMTNWAHSLSMHYLCGTRAMLTMCDDRWYMDAAKFEGAQR